MILGVGLDLVETERIERAVSRRGERFLSKVLTDTELAYCRGRRNAEEHIAARWAAKEAAAKALGTGVAEGVLLRDIEVVNGPAGGPTLVLSGGAARRAEEMGVGRVHLTLTHTGTVAGAVVVLESGGEGGSAS